MGSEKEERQPGKHHFSVVILTTGLIQARISQGKAARAEYNRSLSALEQAQRVALHAHAPRFAPLGIDHEGRTYFALTPGVAERDAAAALLAGDTSKGGKAHGRVIVSADERRALRRWGWFVAVWGQKPADGLVPASEEDDDDGDEEESDDDDATVVERWWGLWQAGEIRKLADWVAIKNGFAGGEQPIAEDEAGVSGPDARRYPPTTEAESNGSRSGVQSSHLTPLSDASDTEDEAGVPSVSGDGSDAEVGCGGVGNEQMRVDEDGRAIPTQNELKALVRALRECAEVLDWRAWRMEEEPGPVGKENGVGKERTKAVAGQIKTVSPANFYGPAAR